MKGIRFYEEFTNKRKGISAGNVFALDLYEGDNGYYRAHPFGTGAVFDEPNSPVAGTGVSWEWLRAKCKRVSEAHARTVHPVLFARLDSFADGEA